MLLNLLLTLFCFNIEQKVEIFKTSDYDLNKDERKAKYKDYDHIICEECNKEIDRRYYYHCTDCCDKKIDKYERIRMKNGRCNECFQIIANDCDECLSCKPKRFQRDFDKWT